MKTVLILVVIFFTGCSQKITHPIQLESGEERNINLPLINKTKRYVPKDTLMMSQSWHYKQTTYRGRYLFANEEIAATFYLAHHATHIYIQGNEYSYRKYRNYFRNNQVTAVIKYVPNARQKRNKTVIDYFRINKNHDTIKVSTTTTGKNLISPSCEVVEIPNNFVKDFK